MWKSSTVKNQSFAFPVNSILRMSRCYIERPTFNLEYPNIQLSISLKSPMIQTIQLSKSVQIKWKIQLSQSCNCSDDPRFYISSTRKKPRGRHPPYKRRIPISACFHSTRWRADDWQWKPLLHVKQSWQMWPLWEHLVINEEMQISIHGHCTLYCVSPSESCRRIMRPEVCLKRYEITTRD